MSGKVIVLANQKGGCAKTVSTYNLSAALMTMGKTVLMIDMDPQYSLTTSTGKFPGTKEFPKYTTSDLYCKESEVDPLDCAYTINALDEVDADGNITRQPLYIVSATQELSLKILNIPTQQLKNFKKNVTKLKDYFDYILIDCSPSLDMIVLSALMVADYAILPTKPEFLDVEGLNLIQSTIATIKSQKTVVNKELYNPKLKTFGVIATMFRKNVTQHKECVAQLAKKYNLLGSVPLSAVVVKEIPNGLPVVTAHKNTQAAKEYIAIAKKIMEAK